MSLSFHFGKPGTGMSLYAPPAAVNDAALSSGSGQVRAVGGAPSLQKYIAEKQARHVANGGRLLTAAESREAADLYFFATGRRAITYTGAAALLKKSNVDQFGKLVKKGCTVSYHGVRGRVAKVSRGACCVEYMHFSGRLTGGCEWLDCELLQVVS